jgi:VanZ family protein
MEIRMILNRNLVKYGLPVIFWMCFIFWMSTETFSSQYTFSWVERILHFLVSKISFYEVGLIHTWMRKSGHVIEYFILGLLLFRAFRGGSIASWNWRWSFFAVLLVLLWATSDEFHQSFVRTRTASVVDVVIDTAGGMFAQLVSFLWYRYRKKKRGSGLEC